MSWRQVHRVRRSAGIAVMGAAALGLTACGVSGSSSTSPTGGAKTAPKQITVGTLYASSGQFAASSIPQYDGLKFWIKQVNADGGVFVKAYNKKIPVKLVSYNDESSASTAGTLYNQLITQDHVDVMVPDFGSVLTAAAVSIAKEHKQLLFDATASGTSLFTADNPYIVMSGIRSSSLWPDPLTNFMVSKKIKRVAIVYGANDFDGAQAATIKAGLAKNGVTPVYYQSTPTDTTTYGTLLNSISAQHPDAVVELGYQNNDIAFLKALSASGQKYKMVFTAFPGQLHTLLQSNVGTKALEYTYSYGFPPQVEHNKVTLGMTTAQFAKAYGGDINFLNTSGYATGLVVQSALANATKFTQLDMRDALTAQSGKLSTILGQFQIDKTGAQTGEFFPLSQMIPGGGGTQIKVVYPASAANFQAKYPAP
ncbi:ABC transporter substrate-binding protein [Dermatophilaceae bacterium Sec6.4]